MISVQTIALSALAAFRPDEARGHHLLQARAEAEQSERREKSAPPPAAAQPAVYGQPVGSSQAATLILAQQAAQSAGEAADTTQASSAAEQTLLDYMQKSPEERRRAAILKDLGLTEDQLAGLPPEEREKIERDIQDRIEKRMALQAEDSAERAAS